MKNFRSPVLACVLIALAGCSHETADWKAATTANTADAYQQFVTRYPKSEHDAEAQTHIAQLKEMQDWQAATDANTRQGYEQYLSEHPEGPKAQEARIRLENFAQTAAPAVASAAAAAAASAPPTGAAAHSRPLGPAAAVARSASGAHYVQLGAFRSRAHAEHHWNELERRFAQELGGLRPRYVKGSSHAAAVVRLQVAVASRAQGKSLCAKLHAHAQACVAAGAG